MNTFGNDFKITIFGASHSKMLGVVIDGCPAGMAISEEDFAEDIARRKPALITETTRKELDEVQIVSGVFNGFSTGAAITLIVCNDNVDSSNYNKNRFRPSHSDFVANKKYSGYNDYIGGGIFSGRMSILLVMAGVIAKKILKEFTFSTKILSIGGVKNDSYDGLCDDIISLISSIKEQGDTLGGIIECRIGGIKVGIGEPFFNSIESMLSHIIFSIPGIIGIGFGDGFENANKRGSEVNDIFIDRNGKTETNHFGGINGGISNGNEIVFRIAVRPPASIQRPQTTFDFETNEMTEQIISGRHDVCFATRMPVIIELASAIALADLFLKNKK